MKKLMIAIAGAMAIGFSANAGNELWFGGSSNNWAGVGGTWSGTNEQVEVGSDGRLEIFADAATPVTFTATEPQGVDENYSLTFAATLEFAPHESIDGVPTDGKAGICIVTNTTGNCLEAYVLEADGSSNVWVNIDAAGTTLYGEIPVSVVVTNSSAGDVKCGSAVYTINGFEYGPVNVVITNGVAGSEDYTFSTVAFSGDGYLKSVDGLMDDGGRVLTLPALSANVQTNKVMVGGYETDPIGGKYQYSVGYGDNVEIYYIAAPGHFYAGGATQQLVWSGTINADTTLTAGDLTTPEPTETAEAQNGANYFYTLTNALHVAQATQTVKLLKTTAYGTGCEIAVKEGVTLDLNKFDLTVALDSKGLAANVTNAGTIVVYDMSMGYASAYTLKDLTGTLKAGVTIGSESVGMVYPSNTTVTCTKELVSSAENENTLVTQTINVGADDTVDTLYWANVINPYQQVTVNGKAKFAGAAVSAGLSEKLTSKLIVNGNLEITQDVAVGNYAELKVTGTLTTNSKTITIGDEAGINSKFTCKKDTVVTVASGNASYDVAKTTEGGLDVYQLGQLYTVKAATGLTGGSVTVDKDSALAGATITVTATPATGYALETITTNGQTLAGNTFVMPAENVTVAATFTNLQYTITWKYDADTVVDTTKVTYDEMPTHTNFLKAGYTQNGWNPELAKATADATYTAVFTANAQTISITLNGANGPAGWTVVGDVATTNFTVETPDFVLPTLTKTDCTFKGYVKSGETATNLNVTIEQGTVGSAEYTACFESAAQPVVPGGEIKKDTPAEATDLANEINNDTTGVTKAKYLQAPTAMTAEEQAEYNSYFDAKAVDTSVTFVLNEDGVEAVSNKQEVASTNALATILSATTSSTTVSVSAEQQLKGFYYSLKQGGEVANIGFNRQADANNLATGAVITFSEVAKPTTKGFYQMIVSPTNLTGVVIK